MTNSRFFNIAFDDIKKVHWTNDFTSFTLATALLMLVYQKRPEPEAEVFRSKMTDLRETFLAAVDKHSSFLTSLQRSYPIESLPTGGDVRLHLNHLLSTVIPEIVGDPSVVRLVRAATSKDTVAAEMDRSQDALWKRHGRDWTMRWLGGSHQIDQSRSPVSHPGLPKDLTRTVVAYSLDLMHLCHESGLTAYWAPALFFMDTMLQRKRPSPPGLESMPHGVVSLDAVFSVMFPHRITKIIQVDDKAPVSRVFPEYLLMLMSRPDIRNKLSEAEANLGEWGYTHGFEFSTEDFHMLFERLCLGLSVEKITERYSQDTERDHSDSSRTQRHTSKLAEFLGLKLPRARYTKQS